MDRQYIRDHQVIERYLSGALTADEEQAFEEAYLGDQELLDQVQVAERLRDGIKSLDSAGGLERLRAPARGRQWFASRQYAAAASVLLAVSLGFSAMLYRENIDLRETGGSQASERTRLVRLEVVRGGGDAPQIVAPELDVRTVLQLDAGAIAYDTYRGSVMRLDGDRPETIWTRSDLVTELDGETVLIGVPGRDLQPGDYEARLEGRMSEWPAGRFDEISRLQLRVVPRN
jgi:hypothetical protein